MSRSKEVGYYETDHKCNYNKHVVCCTPIQDRPCGNCGWRPAVTERRKDRIREERESRGT
jgi:hypothetical protein